MKPIELMIDDFVAVKHIGDKLTHERVIAVDEYSIAFIDSDNTVAHYSLAVVEPIPLTEEILKAFGFAHINNIWYNDPFSLIEEHGRFFIDISGFKKELRCVHELQHALRLCGLNDLAFNFKLKAMEE